MWKKTIPLLGVSALILVGCNNNGALPKNNETPMENIQDRTQQWVPDTGNQNRNREGWNNNNNYNGTTNGTVVPPNGTAVPRNGTVVEPNVRNGIGTDNGPDGQIMNGNTTVNPTGTR